MTPDGYEIVISEKNVSEPYFDGRNTIKPLLKTQIVEINSGSIYL